MPEAHQERVLDEPSKELMEMQACMARINERERQQKIASEKQTLIYTERFVKEICERISCGELLINICLDEHMPTMRRCTQWLREHDDFNALYAESLQDRLKIFEEQEVIQIADDISRDFRTIIKNSVEKRILDPEAIMRAKLRVKLGSGISRLECRTSGVKSPR